MSTPVGRASRLLVLVGLTWALSVVVTPTPDPFLVAPVGSPLPASCSWCRRCAASCSAALAR